MRPAKVRAGPPGLPYPSRCSLSEKEPPSRCALWGCTGLGVWQLASRVLGLRPQALGCQVLDSGSKQSPLPPALHRSPEWVASCLSHGGHSRVPVPCTGSSCQAARCSPGLRVSAVPGWLPWGWSLPPPVPAPLLTPALPSDLTHLSAVPISSYLCLPPPPVSRLEREQGCVSPAACNARHTGGLLASHPPR